MNKRSVILRPVLTEKSNLLKEDNKYTILVNPRLNKIEVKKTLKDLFKVDALKCRIINRKGKVKLTRNGKSKAPTRKIAIVTLKEGQKIDLFEV